MKSLAVASRSFSRNQVLRSEVLKRYPDAKFNDDGLSLSGDSLVNFLAGYEKAILALETIDESILSQLPTLKVIGKYGVGLDMLDLPALQKYGVKLGWTPGVNKRSVAELVVSFAISLLHRAVFATQKLKMANGIRSEDVSYRNVRSVLLDVGTLVKMSLDCSSLSIVKFSLMTFWISLNFIVSIMCFHQS